MPSPAQNAPWWHEALVSEPVPVLAVLLAVLASIFALERTGFGRVYRVVPILVFCYFVPTVLSNTGVIPSAPPTKADPAFPLYGFVMDWLLPASLLLLILAVDVRAIARLGKPAIVMFLTAAVSIMLGGPLAYLALGWLVDDAHGPQTWRGLAALCGSWIGGGANYAAIGKSVGISDEMFGVMVVVDVAIANLWMIALLYFADRHRSMDERIGADASSIDRVRRRSEDFAREVAAPTDLPALLAIGALGLGGTAVAAEGARLLATLVPENDILREFTWKIVLVTLMGLVLSFTPLRHLEGKGASKVGAVFLYLLVASIGARAHFAGILDPLNAPILAIGALWMAIHVVVMLVVRQRMRAPIFFAAVGSKACIGGAASAPIVAAAFSPALAPVGALLAIGGYVLGTVFGLGSAFLLESIEELWRG
jgi:uncharacterized membrane protein